MDYLDPQKQSRHRIIMLVGYVVIAIAIVTATMILMYQAYGFGIGQHGTVIQNGLVFMSSQPVSAQISIDGVNKTQTSARLVLPSGIYNFKLTRSGYHDWQRAIEVQGGSVTHYDYPLLIPTTLKPVKLQDFTVAPYTTTQSPDRRWLLIQRVNTPTFDLFDLKSTTKLPITLSLPVSIITKAKASESWQTLDWADDNQHLLVQHNYDSKFEYILIDRQNIDQSVNLSTTLAISDARLSLREKKYDQYYVYDNATASLKTAGLITPVLAPLLERVLSYKTYGPGSVLYITDTEAPAGKVLLKLMSGSQTYIIRSFPTGGNYLIDITVYSGKLYVAAGLVSESKVYIYKDPVGQLKTLPDHAVVPIQVLHINNPSYLSFSTSLSQFVLAENGTQFAVYDLENRNGYRYVTSSTIDAPQTHANWTDGSHLTYDSNGKLVIFDFDSANQQTLATASPDYLPFFSADYRTMYYFTLGTDQIWTFNQVSLLAS